MRPQVDVRALGARAVDEALLEFEATGPAVPDHTRLHGYRDIAASVAERNRRA